MRLSEEGLARARHMVAALEDSRIKELYVEGLLRRAGDVFPAHQPGTDWRALYRRGSVVLPTS